jgi:hypothetical protein
MPRASRFPASKRSHGEPTARLTLNAVNTTFVSVTADVALDAAAETATFAFAQPLAAGAHRLRIE